MSGQFSVSIRDFRSIKEAEITVSKIALVTGPNTSGKTSIFHGIAATFTGDKKVYGVTQKDLSRVVQEGSNVSSIALSGKGWERVGMWPGDWIEAGQAPHIDPVVLGQEDPAADYDAKQWARYLRNIAGGDSKITWEDVLKRLPEFKGDDDRDPRPEIEKALKASWDAAAKYCKDEALMNRRRWESVTGGKFGKDKADGWAPEHFAGDGPNDLTDEIKNLSDELSHAKSRDEIQGGQIDELKEHYEEMARKSQVLTGKLQASRTKVGELQKSLSFYPMSDPLECPDCGAKVELKGGKLTLYKPGQYVKGSPEHLGLLNGLEKAKSFYDQYAAENGKLIPMMHAELAMIKKIETLKESLREPAVIQDELDGLLRRHKAAIQHHDATEAFEAWTWFTEAEAVLSPTGMRLEATKKAIAKLKPKLQQIASYVFPEHELDIELERDGLGILFDGLPYDSLTWKGDPNSFKLGVQILAQFLSADTMSPETPVLIDRFDTLTVQRRRGVLSWLVHTGRPAIIFQTMSEKPETDKLANGGYGRTYWINDGMVEAVQ